MRRYTSRIGIGTIVLVSLVASLVVSFVGLPVVHAASAPNATLTPGVSAPTYDPVAAGCATATTVAVTAVPKPVAKKVWKRYDVDTAKQRRRLTLDLLVPAQLGGTTDLANVWPLPRRDAATKDAAELSVLAHVCKGEVPLADAQRWFATDWTTAAANADAGAATHHAVLAALAEIEQARLAEEARIEAQRVAEAEAAAAAQAEAERAARREEFLRTCIGCNAGREFTQPIYLRCLKVDAAVPGPTQIFEVPRSVGCPAGYAVPR